MRASIYDELWEALKNNPETVLVIEARSRMSFNRTTKALSNLKWLDEDWAIKARKSKLKWYLHYNYTEEKKEFQASLNPCRKVGKRLWA